MSNAMQLDSVINNGMVVDLLWHERVLKTYTITQTGTIRVGGTPRSEIFVEYLPKEFETVLDIINPYGERDIRQKKLELPNGLSLLCRPLDVTGAPRRGGVGLTKNESFTILLSVFLSALMWFLMFHLQPDEMPFGDEQGLQRENYKARISFAPTMDAAKILETPNFQNDAINTIQQTLRDPVLRSKSRSQELSTQDISKLVSKLGTAANGSGSSDLLTSVKNMDGAKTFGGGTAENWARDFSKGAGRGAQATANLGNGGIGTISKNQMPGGVSAAQSSGMGKGVVEIPIAGSADMSVRGRMDREAIRDVIMRNRQIIRACYERFLSRDADLYGRILLKWTIAEGGRVLKARALENTMGHTGVEQCLLTQLRSWTFPDPPVDEVGEVVFPFVFSSQ